MAMRLISLYSSLMKRRPFLCQVTTAGVLTTTGDIIAQKIEGRPYDIKRTAVMSTCGFGFFGPVTAAWLMFLKRLNLRAFYNVICDQTIAAPIVTGGFVFIHPILSGKGLEEAKMIFKATYVEILLKAWMFWTPAQTINFTFVPFEFRMLYIQSMALLWNTFLSYRSNISLKDKRNIDEDDFNQL